MFELKYRARSAALPEALDLFALARL